MKKAFTMIELLFTMVILSIVAMVASDLIAKTFISYNQVESQHKANLKVEIALNSIANRLSYAIGGTVVKRNLNNSHAPTKEISPIEQAPADYEVLEWVGYDVDGFIAEEKNATITNNNDGALIPAWSGFCNLQDTNKTAIVTVGSDLALEKEVIENLSRGTIQKADNLENLGIFFTENYNWKNIGYSRTTITDRNSSGVAIVKETENNNTFKLDNNISTIAKEHYKLAWSAYAIVPVNFRKDVTGEGDDLFDLVLIHNFRPWEGSNTNAKDYNDFAEVNKTDTTPNRSLLVSNVTVFKTYARQNRIHIKLCVKEMFNINSKTSICKEKVVMR